MLSFSRLKRMEQRIRPYIDIVQKSKSKSDMKQLNAFLKDFRNLEKQTLLTHFTMIFLYLLLYISIVTSIFGTFFLTNFLQQIVSIIGTTVIIVILAFLHWFLGLLRSDAHTVVTEIIALGTKLKK